MKPPSVSVKCWILELQWDQASKNFSLGMSPNGDTMQAFRESEVCWWVLLMILSQAFKNRSLLPSSLFFYFGSMSDPVVFSLDGSGLGEKCWILKIRNLLYLISDNLGHPRGQTVQPLANIFCHFYPILKMHCILHGYVSILNVF